MQGGGVAGDHRDLGFEVYSPVLVRRRNRLTRGQEAVRAALVHQRIGQEALGHIGAAGAATLAEKPELSTTIVVLVAIPETMVILGFVVALVILLRAGG